MIVPHVPIRNDIARTRTSKQPHVRVIAIFAPMGHITTIKKAEKDPINSVTCPKSGTMIETATVKRVIERR